MPGKFRSNVFLHPLQLPLADFTFLDCRSFAIPESTAGDTKAALPTASRCGGLRSCVRELRSSLMTTLSIKVTEDEARALRAEARRARLSLSQLLRGKIRPAIAAPLEIKLVRSRRTGARVFAGTPDMPPLTTESVKDMLESFP